MKNSMLGNFRKVTSGLAYIAVTCIKLVVEAFLESCRICVSVMLMLLCGTAIQCEIAQRFPRGVVKVGLNVQSKNISILSGIQP